MERPRRWDLALPGLAGVAAVLSHHDFADGVAQLGLQRECESVLEYQLRNASGDGENVFFESVLSVEEFLVEIPIRLGSYLDLLLAGERLSDRFGVKRASESHVLVH